MSNPSSPPPKDAIALLMGNAKRKHQSPSPSKKNPKTQTEHDDAPLAKKPKTLEEELKKVKEEGDRSVNIDEKIAFLKKKESDFLPKSAAFWKDGESIPFMFLARAFDLISVESAKNVKINILCNVFRTVIATTPGDLVSFVYLSANKIYPAHDGTELGISKATILESFCEAYGKKATLSDAVKVIKQVYSVHPKYDTIVSALLSDGVLKLPEICTFVLGVPVSPMLASITKGVSEILDKFQNREFTCEYKYHGERAQIHYLEDGSVQIYSRNGKTNTGKFPDVIQSVQRFKKPSVTSFVLDCEIVAFDRKNSKIASFQKLRTRTPKNASEVPVCILAFDILYLNGELLLQEQLSVRRKHLYNSFVEVPGEFKFATQVTSNDLDAIQSFLDTAIADSCEGLVVKTLSKEATYEPAERSNNWLKLKDYMDNTGDSLDLVPIGAYHGTGKRAKAGAVDATKGISLRFPRLLRVREDNKTEEATTSNQIADMYRAQKINHGNNQDEPKKE
ncbi:hypothetical protein C5167_028753 [Papaver somniferum]|nr:hypothetical protein C5167_028753 [Papaver somniferum]